MTVVVHIVEGPDADEALSEGPRHPVLGGLIDCGTLARISENGGPVDGDSVAEMCEKLGPDVRLVRTVGRLPPDSRAALEAEAAQRPLFVLLLGTRSLVLAAGPDLPTMGSMPDCDVVRLAASVRFALGQEVWDSLFNEPSGFSAVASERDLDARLRQLYGQ